jgi:hypothetical protein
VFAIAEKLCRGAYLVLRESNLTVGYAKRALKLCWRIRQA